MKKFKYILAAVGFALPLLGLINDDLLILTLLTNPLALYFTHLISKLYSLSTYVSITVLAPTGGLIYFILGNIIEELYPSKKTESEKGELCKRNSVIFLIFLIIISLFAAMFFYEGV